MSHKCIYLCDCCVLQAACGMKGAGYYAPNLRVLGHVLHVCALRVCCMIFSMQTADACSANQPAKLHALIKVSMYVTIKQKATPHRFINLDPPGVVYNITECSCVSTILAPSVLLLGSLLMSVSECEVQDWNSVGHNCSFACQFCFTRHADSQPLHAPIVKACFPVYLQ